MLGVEKTSLLQGNNVKALKVGLGRSSLLLVFDEVLQHVIRIAVSSNLRGQNFVIFQGCTRPTHTIGRSSGHHLKQEPFKYQLIEHFEIHPTSLDLGWLAGALGQSRVTTATLSPLSWQHMHDLSVCHILDPETLT